MTRTPAGRVVVVAIAASVLLAVVGLTLALFPTPPTVTLDSEAPPSTMTVEEAEQVTLDRYNELADPGCHAADTEPPAAPLSAIVKFDGTIDVERIPADDAFTAAQSGEVWILGWCESEGVTP